jgi:hypothetical protein
MRRQWLEIAKETQPAHSLQQKFGESVIVSIFDKPQTQA